MDQHKNQLFEIKKKELKKHFNEMASNVFF